MIQGHYIYCALFSCYYYFSKKLSSNVQFLLIWLVFVCGLTKTVTDTNMHCSKEAQMEVVNKIIGGAHMD